MERRRLRTSVALSLVLATLSESAQAGVYSCNWDSGFANGGVIPDGSLVGWSDTRQISDIPEASLTDVQVTLQIEGYNGSGWNGDLYGYLVHGTGFAVLLNRVGVTANNSLGYGDNGSSVRQTFCSADFLWPGSQCWLRSFLLRRSSSLCDTAVTRL